MTTPQDPENIDGVLENFREAILDALLDKICLSEHRMISDLREIKASLKTIKLSLEANQHPPEEGYNGDLYDEIEDINYELRIIIAHLGMNI